MTACGMLPKAPGAKSTRGQPHSYANHPAEESNTAPQHTSDGEPTVTVPQLPSELLPHVEQWEADTGLELTTELRFTERDLGPAIIAICLFQGKLILVSQEKWGLYTEEVQEEIIYHELGHCEFGFRHDNHQDELGRPVSIMNWKVLNHWNYKRNREEYVREYLGKIGQLVNGRK